MSVPPTYRPAYAEEARKLALAGATDTEMAWCFDVPLATLRDWLASVPEFVQAVQYGRTSGDADVVESFRQIVVGCFPEVVTRPVGAEGTPDLDPAPSAPQGSPEFLAEEPPARRVSGWLS